MKSLAFVFAFVVCAVASDAQAQLINGGIGNGGFGGGAFAGALRGGYFNIGAPMPGQAYGFSYPGQNLQDRMPHFALFPPVYYSMPVPRTYGYSPFAYPGFVQTPNVSIAIAPQVITNPYVEPAPSKAVPKSPSKPTPGPRKASTDPRSPNSRLGAVQPLRSLNPYFGDQFVETAK
jgi:hypothetical protein